MFCNKAPVVRSLRRALLTMGVLLALIAVRTGSLWASVITHGVNNLCAALVAVFLAHF